MKNKNGKLLTQPEQDRKGWEEYFSSLHDEPNPVKNLVLDEPPPSGDCPDTPGILLEEVQNALRKMKKQNAPGIDNITAEELQLAMEDEGFESLMEAHMSSMGNQPNKYLLTGKIIIIPIHKKKQTRRQQLPGYNPVVSHQQGVHNHNSADDSEKNWWNFVWRANWLYDK